MSEFPRRIQMQQWTPAEHAIQQAVDAVEAMGADVRLTDAVILLGKARDRVADFVDGVEGLPPTAAPSEKARELATQLHHAVLYHKGDEALALSKRLLAVLSEDSSTGSSGTLSAASIAALESSAALGAGEPVAKKLVSALKQASSSKPRPCASDTAKSASTCEAS